MTSVQVQYEEIDDDEIEAVIRASQASSRTADDSDSSELSTGADVGKPKE
eukprot:SAG31_NODE_5378_length_2576_cov_1.025434_3_plen_50_part_00